MHKYTPVTVKGFSHSAAEHIPVESFLQCKVHSKTVAEVPTNVATALVWHFDFDRIYVWKLCCSSDIWSFFFQGFGSHYNAEGQICDW